jgi:serine/threonine protein kinase
LKKLISTDRDAFDRELASLLYFQGTNQKSLIKLLLTFEIEHYDVEGRKFSRFYFLFPCAQGDLWKFWRDHSSRQERLGRIPWTAEQFYQLASGLQEVHNERDRSLRTFPAIKENDHELYGRHGDVKAENILWFSKDSYGHDTFVIADFGLCRLHTRISRSNQNPKALERTASYRAPEFDTEDGKISRAADIYSLGCMFLEYVTWLLEGWESVHDKFPEHRTERDKYGFFTDTFFQIERLSTGKEIPKMKTKVKDWIKKLRKHADCNQYVSDFLDLIEHKMLHPLSQPRIKINYLEKELGSLARACTTDSNYLDSKYYWKPSPRNF